MAAQIIQRTSVRAIAAGVALAVFAALAPSGASAVSTAGGTLPSGFSDVLAFDFLTEPTVMEFAPDGRVYVGEKRGRVQVFDSLSDPTPTLVKDLSSNVHNFWDRGMLGMALDPAFTAGSPYVYVLYSLDAPIGGTPPVFYDTCGDPEGAGCVIGARLSRFEVLGNGTGGAEQILIEGWCQQFPSHSIGTLAFGRDGALYVGGGEGANFSFADFGQVGNPCADPAGEGGALRSQDLRTVADPTGLNGAILRVDKATGLALPDNPLIGGDPSDDRIIAYGLRNPFRFAVKPKSDRIFVGDVGWYIYEEVNRIVSAGDAVVENFGWPCYEGKNRQPDYDGENIALCESLYAGPKPARPDLQIRHALGGCAGSNVLSGMAFYRRGTYPTQYNGALFFTDIVRECLWVMLPKPNGDPDPGEWSTFGTGISAVDIKTGPNGDLFYADMDAGEIRRITFTVAST